MDTDKLFCPLCGSPLTDAKPYYHNPDWLAKECPQHKLWDIHRQDKNTVKFHSVQFVACHKCGKSVPEREARRDYAEKKVAFKCPECYEAECKAWRMDKEKSYARLEITPVRTEEGVTFRLDDSIQIEPYPNPFSYGGKYGGNHAKDEEELKTKVAKFEAEVAGLKQQGMERVEIIRHDEVVRTSQTKLPSDPILSGLAQSLANKTGKPIAIEPAGIRAEPVKQATLFEV